MQQLRLNGPGAGSDKYDLLTALSVAALAQGGQMQISLLRLMAVITARYNWAQDELSLGQREMAQMWSVDERTAKREVKRLTELGVLLVLRKGVKGRVATYRLCLSTIVALTKETWELVGRDFSERMLERHLPKPEAPKVVRVDFAAKRQNVLPEGDDPWSSCLRRLQAADPVKFASWFAGLKLLAQEDGLLIVQAPSQFAAQYVTTHFLPVLEAAVRAEFGHSTRCLVRG